MKYSQLIKIIKETIKEQSVVGAKGCCKELHLAQRMISQLEANLTYMENELAWMQESNTPDWMFDNIFGPGWGQNDIAQYEMMVNQAQMTLETAQQSFAFMQSQNCCKGDRY